jgi:dihydroorotase
MATLDAFVPLWLALATQGVSPRRLVECVASAPQQVLGQERHQLVIGAPVNLTLIDPGCRWRYQADTSVSAAMNTPFLGHLLQGKVLATWSNGIEIYRSSSW